MGAVKKLTFLVLVNVAVAGYCLELWREGQPAGRMLIAACVSYPALNAIVWWIWRRSAGR